MPPKYMYRSLISPSKNTLYENIFKTVIFNPTNLGSVRVIVRWLYVIIMVIFPDFVENVNL